MQKVIYLLIFLCISTLVVGQSFDEDQEQNDNFYQKYLKGKLYTGGGGGLSFGTVTNVSFNPIIGYRATEKLQGGVGINYLYINNKYYGVDYSAYGARAFANYLIIPQAYLIGEYNLMNIEFLNRSVWERGWFPAILAGAGYRQSLGGLSSYNLEVLWNVLNSPVYPINMPIIRASINIGF